MRYTARRRLEAVRSGWNDIGHESQGVRMIKVGCCAFVFGSRGLDEALRLVAELGFRHVDVSAADIGPKAQVDQQLAADRPKEMGRKLRRLAARYGLVLEELFHVPGVRGWPSGRGQRSGCEQAHAGAGAVPPHLRVRG